MYRAGLRMPRVSLRVSHLGLRFGGVDEEQPRRSRRHASRRADDMCRRRLAHEHAGGKRHANRSADARFAVSNRLFEDAQLAHAELDHCVRGVRRPQGARARAARAVPGRGQGLSRRVRRPARVVRPNRLAHRNSPSSASISSTVPASRSNCPTAAASSACSISAAAARRAVARSGRTAASRSCEPRSGRPTSSTIVAVDLIEQELHRATIPISPRTAPRPPSGSPNACRAGEGARGRRRAPRSAPTARAARSSPAATGPSAIDGGPMKKRLLPTSCRSHRRNYDDFAQCARRFLNAASARNTRKRCRRAERQGSARPRHVVEGPRRRARASDDAYVADVLAGHTAPTTTTSARSSSATPQRCPSGGRRAGARTSRRWRASTASRSRCSWQRRASTRSGSTTGSSTPATTRPAGSGTSASPTCPRRRSRRSCSTCGAFAGGCSCGSGTSTCSAEIDDDPDAWELDDDDMRRDRGGASFGRRAHARQRMERRRRRGALLALLVPLDLPRQRRTAANRPGPCSLRRPPHLPDSVPAVIDPRVR